MMFLLFIVEKEKIASRWTLTLYSFFSLFATTVQESRMKTIAGTPYYIAPEILSSSQPGYNYTADIWSVGISIIEMFDGTIIDLFSFFYLKGFFLINANF